MRAITICLIAIAVTGNVLTSTALAQGSNAAVRLNLPGGGAEIICLASAIELGVSGTELLLRADALQNNLGCPPGVTAPSTDAGVDQPTQSLRGSTNARAILRLDLPGGGSTDKCLLLGSAAASAVDQASFMNLQALQADGGCPPPAAVTLNDFQLSPSQLDITPGSSNCSISGQPRRCLTVSWNTDVPPDVLTPVCNISQTAPSGQTVMQPGSIDNPGNFVNPGNPGQFVSIANNLLWPVNDSMVSPGGKSFRMQCEPGGQSITRTVSFSDNRVLINNFNINQSSAAQGAQFNYSWDLSVLGNPVNPTCAIRSLTTGVINTISINPLSNPTGSGTGTILPDAPLGPQTLRLECSPLPTQQDDTIIVTEPSAVQLESFNIQQTSAQPGSSFNFSWTLSLNGNPSNPSCTFDAVNSGVIAAPVVINNPALSGSRSVNLLAGATQGQQTFIFSCSPGNSSLNDSLNVTSPRVIPISFTPQLSVVPGELLNFDWSVFLASNPGSPQCQVSSTSGGFISPNPLQFILPGSPSSQSGSGSIQVLGSASTGNKLLRFSCSPGNEPAIEVTVNVVEPTPASVLVDSFNVVESSSQQGGLLNFTFSVSLLNNPPAPGCRIDSPTSGVTVVGDIINLPTTPLVQNGNGTATVTEVLFPNIGQNASIRLRCFPNIASPNGASVATDTILIESSDTPSVAIANFDIVENSINPGGSFNVNWMVRINGSPTSPSCTLSSNVAGVISDRIITLSPGNGDQSGSLPVSLLPQAPTGIQLFTLSCQPGTSVRTDSLQIVSPDANPRVQINDFQLLQSTAVQGQTLGFSWNVTLIDNPQTPSCVVLANGVINQFTLPLTTSPATQSGTATLNILGSAPTGVQSFSLNCNPGGAQSFASALITAPNTPELFIDEFQIAQSSAAVGEEIDFNWAITLVNTPSDVDCRLSSPGTINQVIIPVSAAAVQSGNGSVEILPTTPGTKNFSFVCTASDASTVSVSRQVEIVSGSVNPSVGIISFDVLDQQTTQGGSFNFNWSVLLTDIAGPGIASCTLNGPGVLTAPVTIQLDPINGLTQSGVASAQVSATAGTGVQSLQFSCTPGTAMRTDSINVQQSGGDPDVIINSFNIVETEAARGAQIQFDWNITLVDAPQNVSCTLSSDNASVINNFTLNLASSPSLQSGSNTVNINTGAATGAQGFRFTCLPGGDQLVDSVLITAVPTARIDINSFNIIETGAAQGGTINFVWDVTLLNNPASPQCVLSSNSNGVISDQVINLAASPANQNGGGSVSISTTAATGNQTFTFVCNPDGEFRTDSVNITVPGTLNLLFFDVRNVSAPRLSDIIFDFTVQRVNNPVNPECTLSAAGVIVGQTIPVPTGGVTIQPLEGLTATILETAPLGTADFTLTCSPGGQSMVEQINITTIPDPGISINSFNIVQQTASPGDIVQFDYSVTRIGQPLNPECVILATSQTSAQQIIPISTSGAATVIGSGDLPIFATAPPGDRQFTFACRTEPSAPFEDAFGDFLTIQ